MNRKSKRKEQIGSFSDNKEVLYNAIEYIKAT